jgi:uncharacterized protein
LRAATVRKYRKLGEIIESLGRVAVAYSGGVDSTLLVRVALDRLGAANVVAIIAASPTYPESERQEAEALAAEMGVLVRVIDPGEMQDPLFVANTPDRCYHCKSHLIDEIQTTLKTRDEWSLVEGSNSDDTQDYRPGRRAVEERRVRSPLAEAGLTKEEIREISAELGLPTARKPAKACLASRIPYGTPITVRGLKMVEKAEDALRALGFKEVRVRHHGQVARIEVGREEIERLLDPAVRKQVVRSARGAGFTYVALDLEGYRSGSMNETLAEPDVRSL